MRQCSINIRINGRSYSMSIAPNRTLLDLLRNELGLLGTKCGCEIGECGACTVILDGRAVNSCLVLAPQIDGSTIVTIEGLAHDGHLDRLQQAFIDNDAVQCGFCTPGMLMSVKALLAEKPHPTERDVRLAISGNLCRCTGYQQIVDAVIAASSSSSSERSIV